jgi:hypothetical protein
VITWNGPYTTVPTTASKLPSINASGKYTKVCKGNKCLPTLLTYVIPITIKLDHASSSIPCLCHMLYSLGVLTCAHMWWCELGFPIFRKVLITLDLVESRHNSIRLPNNSVLNPAIAAPRPLWLSTGVARSTSPRRLSPCLRIENTRKNTKECNQIADEWLISQSWGLTNRRRRRNCYQQNNLSKTQP